MRMQLCQIRLQQIENRANYRKRLEVDADFLASIVEHGVLQPVLLVQVAETGYKLVAGQRRLEAARQCKHLDIPAMVIVDGGLADTDLDALAVVENGQRRDPTPLEEAAVIEGLLQRGLTIAEVSKKLSRPAKYLVQRVSLLRLRAPTVKLIADGRLGVGHALLIARLRLTAEDEQRAVSLVYPAYADQAVSVKAAAAVLATAFLRALCDAPFPTDVDFGNGRGPCAKCSKRTGQQPELFADVKVKNVCPDSVCWQGKIDCHWARVSAAHAGQLIEGEEAAGMFAGRQLVDARYIDLDAVGEDGKPNRESVAFEDGAVRYVRDSLGWVHPVVKRGRQVATPAAVAKPERKDGPKGPSRKQYEIAGEFLITRMLEFFDIRDEEVHAWVCETMLLSASRPTLKRLLLRRGVEVGAESSAKDLVSQLYHRIEQSGQPGEPVEDVAKILLEVLFTEAVLDDPDGKLPSRLMQLAAVQGLPPEPELLKEAEEAMRAAKVPARRHYDA